MVGVNSFKISFTVSDSLIKDFTSRYLRKFTVIINWSYRWGFSETTSFIMNKSTLKTIQPMFFSE